MSATASICLVRHGETDWNVAGILQGWTDVALNPLGCEQALQMAHAMAAQRFTRVCSSPLQRALRTAEIIAEELGLPAPSCHEGLKERNFGAIQGTPKAELAELNPRLLQQILTRNPATEFELGETMDEFADRVIDATVDIGTRYPHERILVITHGWVLDVLTRELGQLPRHAILDHKPKNGDRLWLQVKAGQLAVLDGFPVKPTGHAGHR